METKEHQTATEATHAAHGEGEEAMGASSPGVETADPEATQASQDGEAVEVSATLEEQLASQRQKTDEYVQHLQRLQADFQNYRRRVTQEKLQAASRGKEEVFHALLPILANLRLALQHANQDANAVREGVQMIWQQFEGFLRDQGVERIATVGERFDPARHEVLTTAPATAEAPADTIVAEIKAGYLFDDRLLCPAQVVVARAEEASAATEAPA